MRACLPFVFLVLFGSTPNSEKEEAPTPVVQHLSSQLRPTTLAAPSAQPHPAEDARRASNDVPHSMSTGVSAHEAHHTLPA